MNKNYHTNQLYIYISLIIMVVFNHKINQFFIVKYGTSYSFNIPIKYLFYYYVDYLIFLVNKVALVHYQHMYIFYTEYSLVLFQYHKLKISNVCNLI
jgi:hypothetical protein